MSAENLRSKMAAIATLATALLASACLEPPVEERLDLRFLPGGDAVLTSDLRLLSPNDFKHAPAVADRIRATADEAQAERDPWTSRLRAASPDRERFVLDRSGGEIRRVVRYAHVRDAAEVERVFDGTGVRARYRTGEGWAELALLPDSGGNASAAEQRELRARFDAWTPRIVTYLRACNALWHYLDTHPDRAKPCFRRLFGGEKGTDDPENPPLTDDEKQMADDVSNAGGEVLKILEVPEGQAYSTDELSRRVHDPFPAPVTIQVSGKILDREGFEREGSLEIPSHTLWNAWQALCGRWVEPDPLVTAWRNDRDPKKEFDLDAFVARPRRIVPAPTEDELRDAIAKAMEGPAVYRVRWSTVESGGEAVTDPFETEP